jgi:fatty acid desaturase
VTTNKIAEPTNQDIMEKLHKIQDELNEAEVRAELRDRVLAWIALMAVGAGFALASIIVHQWWNVLIGGIFVIIGFLGVLRRWPPRW